MDLLNPADRYGLVNRLSEFEDVLHHLGIDIRQRVAPGVNNAAFDYVAERTGLELPDEAKDWFRWQNGPADAEGPFELGPSVAPGWYLISIEGAIGNYLDGRRLSRRLQGDEGGEGHWPPGLFPIAHGRGNLVVHCDVHPVRAPVDIVDTWSDRPGEQWIFDSIADMVELLTRACRTRALTVAPDAPTQLTYTQYPVPDEIAHPGFW